MKTGLPGCQQGAGRRAGQQGHGQTVEEYLSQGIISRDGSVNREGFQRPEKYFI
jgi:hypothetical protein